MSEMTFRTIAGGETALAGAELRDLRDRIRGDLILRGAAGYEEARTVWNGMIDKQPTLILQCAGAADVIAGVNFARERSLLFSVRGGGHNVAGSALCDGGMVIDLSKMRSVRVDPERRIARVSGGATLGDVDHETQAFGLATPLGVVSRTGVAGLTLGGGFGWLTRRHGLSCDNLRSADVVTAEGELITVSEERHPELFWAIRGGGGNFGVVTSFEYELHPVGPQVMLAAAFYPAAAADSGMRFFRDFMSEAPEELFALAVLWSMPEGPPFPASMQGDPVLVFVGVYSGDLEEGERVVEPLRSFQEPLVDLSGPVSWLEAQTFYDADYPDGMLYYWKSTYLDALSDGAIAALVADGVHRPSSQSNVDVWYLGGAMRRVARDETAFWHRDPAVMIGIEANWADPAQSEANIRWARDLVERLQPYSSGGSYSNFGGFGEEADNPAWKIYGGNYDRLVRVKRAYDPANLFRVNHNIQPGRSA